MFVVLSMVVTSPETVESSFIVARAEAVKKVGEIGQR